MSVSEAIAHMAGAKVNHGKSPNGKTLNGKSLTPAKGNHRTAKRVREATVERVPVEEMLVQLREIIVGPHERLCEARFEELIDIVAEVQGSNEGRFLSIESEIDDIKAASNRMERIFDVFDTRMDKLEETVDVKTREVHTAYGQAIAELRGDFSVKLQMINEELRKSLKDLEMETRKEVLELSSTLIAHVSTENTRWEEERANNNLTLQQRIAQWRAEMDDEHRAEMDSLASSLVEMGQKLLTLRRIGSV
jgi:hypothetical protein